MPNWAGMSKRAPDYRFLAIREPLRELDLGDAEQLPFPTMSFGTAGRYKLFGLVTNRTLPGDDVIRWQRERCGTARKIPFPGPRNGEAEAEAERLPMTTRRIRGARKGAGWISGVRFPPDLTDFRRFSPESARARAGCPNAPALPERAPTSNR